MIFEKLNLGRLSNKKSRIEIRLIFLYNIFMTYIIQDKLKYIFSNNNILLNSLKFCKKNNIGNSHLEYIKLSIDKFLACRDISKGFVKFPTVLLYTCSLLLASLGSVLLAVTGIL
jgi:putative transposase